MERDSKGRFVKGNVAWSKLHPELMPRAENHHWYGKHLSEEAKEKIRQLNLGRKYSPEINKKKGRPRERSGSWKGGQYTSQRGYVYILMREHPYCMKTGYIKRATLIMERHLGRYLIPPELVHHKNNIKDDDSLENLQLCANQSEHRKLSTHQVSHPPILTL